DRLFEHYAYTSSHAAALAYPHDAERLPRPPQTATPTPDLSDPAAATGWLDSEHTNLMAAAVHAVVHRPEHTTHQSTVLHRHLYVRGLYTDAYTLHENALPAAQATGDLAAQAGALTNFGRILEMQGRYDSAAGYHTRALHLARDAGHRGIELSALNGL